MEQWQIEAINEILSTKVQHVQTSDSDYNRFYTEDQRDTSRSSHHLIDLYIGNGAENLQLAISQFTHGRGTSTTIRLDNNEVDELLSVLLQQRLDEAQMLWQEAEERKKRQEADDYDPFKE